jgi:hypothetical protein
MEERILYYLEDLDTRRAFGQPPRKLKIPPGFVLPERVSYFYFYKSQKLMKICPFLHTEVMSPVELSACSNNFFVFNLECQDVTYEYYGASGSVMVDPTYSVPVIVRGPIKFIE